MAEVMTTAEQPDRELARPRHRTIGLRLYEDEIAALDRAVGASGARSRNHLMRRLARRAGGLMDPDAEVIAAWGELVVVMRGLGNNLNQIARQANRDRVIWTDGDREDVAALRRAFGELQRYLIAAHRAARAGRIRRST
jgi:hypothetical protein